MMLRIGDRLVHAFQNKTGCRQVWVADSQVDDIHPARDGLLFHLVNGCKEIRG